MENFSYWGLMNPLKARFIILIAQIMFCLLATYSGIWLFTQNIILPNSLFYAGFGLFFITLILYPVKRARFRFWKHTFAKQMGMSSLLMIGYLMVALTISNREARLAWKSLTNTPQKVSIALKEGTSTSLTAPKKTLRTYFQKKYATYVQKSMQSGDVETSQTVGVIAIVLLMIVCLVGIVALACSASCTGSGGQVTAILVGGTALVLVCGIAIIRSLLKRPKNYQPMPN